MWCLQIWIACRKDTAPLEYLLTQTHTAVSQYTVLFSSEIFISAVPKLGLSMYLFMVYLIGTDRIYKDKLKQLSDASITGFVADANLQHPSLEGLL